MATNKRRSEREHKTKAVLKCLAPGELTRYNKDHNKSVEDACWQEPKFFPKVSCHTCPYLDVKHYND